MDEQSIPPNRVVQECSLCKALVWNMQGHEVWHDHQEDVMAEIEQKSRNLAFRVDNIHDR